METILVVEDDKYINEMLEQLLKLNGYKVVLAYSGTEGLLLYKENIDLVLLDLMLPGKNGEEVIQEMKSMIDLPIIVMSAIGDIDKKIDLFKLGADDYVIKPFSNDELLARINVHLRKNKAIVKRTNILKYKDIEIDIDKYMVTCNNKIVNLTKYEFLILKCLMEHSDRVVTKSILFDIVWGDFISADDNTLNVHISKIRNKLKLCSNGKDYIETIWSVGYKMKSEN